MNPRVRQPLDAVVLLHGVGLDPSLFEPVRPMLPSPAEIPTRSPYAAWSARGDVSIRGQARSLLSRLGQFDAVVVIGLSGGATIAVEMAIVGSPVLVGVVAHEPLLGPAAPALHAVVLAAAARLDATAGRQAPVDFVRGLVGEETWSRLPSEARQFARDHGDAIRREVPYFADFAPSPAELRSIAVPLVVTTGALSHPRRHAAAVAYEQRAGAVSVVIPGAGHLAPWEQPEAFASAVRTCLDEWGVAA